VSSGSATPSNRILFVMSSLPRPELSVRGLVEGRESASGSVSSFLLVVNGLAERGHEVGLLILSGQRLTDSRARAFSNLDAALAWRGPSDPVVWCSWGDGSTADALFSAGIRPWMWTQVHVEARWLRLLESGGLEGIVTVSDDPRLPLLRSSSHHRIGRVYNPLNPYFAERIGPAEARYESARVVFAGHLGPTKGAHLVLRMWPEVRERMPNATLTVAGSARLYGADRPVGPFGVASPAFEADNLQPLADRFGSLDAAGIRLVGLLSPSELRELYFSSSLGLVNFNWHDATETFCCAAVEMLATGLPVLSFARGALPETIGRTGGAILLNRPDLGPAAAEVAALLRSPGRLRALGGRGAAAVRAAYDLDHIVGRWESLLSAGPGRLDRESGRWQQRRGFRYLIERAAGRLGVGRDLEAAIAATRRILRR
jgi:hypothetical protein